MNTFPDDPIECAVCSGAVRRVHATVEVAIGKRESVPVSGVFAKCDRCGEVYFAPGEMDAVHQQANDVVRQREGLLRPDEIREIRAAMRLTQTELERLLRVGPKTVVRWERGTTFQNKATDTLLRALRDVPELRSYLSVQALGADAGIRPVTVAIASPLVARMTVPAAEAFAVGAPQYTGLVINAEESCNDFALVA
jgi:HTH-type transcriptional regulator/antitoxin MqsA